MSLDPLNLNLNPINGPILNNPQLATALNTWSGLVSDQCNMIEAQQHALAAGISYIKTAFTGGGASALNGIDGDLLAGDEMAAVFIGTLPATLYFVTLIADSGATHNPPFVTAPTTNAGTKRWILGARSRRVWPGVSAPTVNDDLSTEHVLGDYWFSGSDIWVCVDHTIGAAVWVKQLKIGTGATDAAAGNHTHSGYEATANKGQANGYAGLDGNGKVPTNQLPAIALTDTYVVASQAAMLALSCQQGDVALRSDESKTYILAGSDPSVLADWKEILVPGGGVASVDSRTGVVSLSDLYAPIAKGVTNGDSHDHNGGDGAQVDHVSLANKGTNTHAQIDTAVSNSASHIAAAAPHSGHVQVAGQIGGTAASPTVVGIKESGGQALAIGAIADGQRFKRSGTNAVGYTRYEFVTLTIDGGGAAITTGTKGWFEFGYDGTIVEWTLLADQSGSIVIDVWKDTYANFPPTVADTITASAKPTLSSAQKATSTTLTGWTTSVTADDIFRFNVDSASTVQRVTLRLKMQLS